MLETVDRWQSTFHISLPQVSSYQQSHAHELLWDNPEKNPECVALKFECDLRNVIQDGTENA